MRTKTILVLFVLCIISCKAPEPASHHLSHEFLEGYASATDAYAANRLGGIAFYQDVPWKEIQEPFLILKGDASDYEVGEFCGKFNAYVMVNQGKWASAYRDSFSIHFFDEDHPASIVARGFVLCHLLKGMKFEDAVEEFDIGTPKADGPFAENVSLSLGHDLNLLIKVDTSDWPKSEDGISRRIPPVEEMVVKDAFLYYKDESVTGILAWAKLSKSYD